MMDENEPLFSISAVSEQTKIHPQTLRQYDRLGLVCPSRTKGKSRKYSVRDIKKILQIQQLSQQEGINLSGIKRILDLEEELYVIKNYLLAKQKDSFFEVQSSGVTQVRIKKTRVKHGSEQWEHKKIINVLCESVPRTQIAAAPIEVHLLQD
jgi:DNA-binding transcriptional MerR regulator